MRNLLTLLVILVPLAFSLRIPFKLRTGSVGAITNVTSGGQAVVWTDNAFFVANITIGTPPQLFTVVIDTSSADLFVPDLMCDYPTGVCALPQCDGVYCNEQCPNKTCCLQVKPKFGFDSNYANFLSRKFSQRAANVSTCFGKRQYNSSASSSYSKQAHVVNIRSEHYGEIDGFTGLDTVTLGTSADEMITIANVAFTQVITMSQRFGNLTDIDGVLGLAFTSASVSGSDPPFVKAVKDGDVVDSVFSIWLEDMWQTSDNGTAGTTPYLGYDVPNHCSTNRTMWPLSQVRQWTFTTTGFTAGTYQNSDKWQTHIDSASHFITAPQKVATQVLNQLGLNANTPLPATVPCNTNISFSFTFPNGGQANIITKNLIVPNGMGGCMLAMRASQQTFTLGIPFLRGRCTYFDTTRQLVGTADALSHN
ncbi:hypothetical protein WR25_15717 [Diploscapter pachys]|uniref:Peptidase A1 domain-containing protein n=1 Tax=Diploscapter pachys TaxID=2018661 RepID=A0A2A2J3E7_9BILA|nr:hypothetical protein WR25_15717 [Diploscapter pachys]